MNSIRGLLLDKRVLSDSQKSAIISTAGKIFHLLLAWGDKSMEKTSLWYLKKTNTHIEITEASKLAIQAFKEWGKWIILTAHKSGTFSDYLPLFAEIWDEILKKSIFYTWAFNLSMNKREFPEYTFKSATLTKREDAIILKQQIQEDIQKVSTEWWFIFIAPSWVDVEENSHFKGLFKRFVSWLDDNFPILVSHVTYDTDRWYKEVALSLLRWKWSTVNVSAQLWSVWDRKNDWKPLSWEEMREKYNKMNKNNVSQ